MLSLSQYLQWAAAQPLAYGEFDCMMYLANWAREVRGVDLAARWRGKYRTEREASRLMAHYGGMEALVDFAVAGILAATDAPRIGDIAIVRPHGPAGEMGAIRTGTGWAALKHHGGIWTGAHRLAAAWSIGGDA